MGPAQCVGVDVDHLVLDETLPAVAHTAGTVGVDAAQVVTFLVKLLV